MSRNLVVALATATALSACSGNPFPPAGTTPPVDPETGIPAEIKGDVDTIGYDPVNKVLVVSGQSLDNTPYNATYVRKPALDRQGYEAYTSQEGSLGRHHTAYVKEIDGVQASVVMAGAQFNEVFHGASYGRTGTYTAPDVTQPGGVVHYAGGYVGLTNGAGDSGDLLPVAPGTPGAIRPRQAAEVVGDVFISADFADNVVDGIVYNRVFIDYGNQNLENLELDVAGIASDGSFTGALTQNAGTVDVGSYGGVFGGTDASAVAGALYAENHMSAFTNELETGVFVLSQCGTANADPVCNQPVP